MKEHPLLHRGEWIKIFYFLEIHRMFLKTALTQKSSLSLRSRRKHKAWGASPRIRTDLNCKPMTMGDSSLRKWVSICCDRAVARIHGLEYLLCFCSWGLRPRLYASACFAG